MNGYGQWNTIQTNVQNDDEWEKAVSNVIQQQRPAPIFILSDDVKQQVTFFRFRRNDCAHGKKNKIDISHVEVLWAFVLSNLPKFMVNGSEDALLNKIRDHFDRTLTPPDKDYTDLIIEIPHAIEPNNVVNFLVRVQQIIRNLSPRVFSPPVPEELDFYQRVLHLNNSDISQNVLQFLQNDEDILVSYLKAYPDDIIVIAKNAGLIRSLWYDKLFKQRTGQEWAVFAAMLRNNLIPSEEIEEAYRRIILQSVGITSDASFLVLKEKGFFRSFHKIAFEEEMLDQFSWGNKNTQAIIYYIDTFPIDLEVARAISISFSKYYNPTTLQEELNKYLTTHPHKKEELVGVIREHDLPWPSYLKVLADIENEEPEE